MTNNKHVKAIFQFREAEENTWIKKNPILHSGEPAVSTDVYKMKVGDGINHWVDIPYISGEVTISPLTHSITIGNQKFDGTKDVVIETYSGDYDEEDSTLLSANLMSQVSIRQLNATSTNSYQMTQISDDTSTMSINENNMTLMQEDLSMSSNDEQLQMDIQD